MQAGTTLTYSNSTSTITVYWHTVPWLVFLIFTQTQFIVMKLIKVLLLFFPIQIDAHDMILRSNCKKHATLFFKFFEMYKWAWVQWQSWLHCMIESEKHNACLTFPPKYTHSLFISQLASASTILSYLPPAQTNTLYTTFIIWQNKFYLYSKINAVVT